MAQVSERVRRAIDRAEADYKRCWEILADVKRGAAGVSIGEFQPKLAEALFRLSQAYQFVSRVRRESVQHGAKSGRRKLVTRLKVLAKRRENLAQAIAIGRGLGDAFAWFFYQLDREYLLEHAKEQENALIPTGVGGQGEVEFIKRTQFVGRLLVLYHGITSILRLGDVTLIDMTRFRVAAIGELKTVRKESEGRIQVTLVFKGSKKRLKLGRIRRPKVPIVDLPRLQEERLKSQLKRIDSLVGSAETARIPAQLGGTESGHVPALGRLVRSTKRSSFGWADAGPGMSLVGYRTGTRSLYWRLNRNPNFSGLPERNPFIARLILPTSPFNRLLSGVLHFSGKGFGPRLLIGSIPMFWWGLEADELKPLMLGEMVAMSIYNPAHLASCCQKAGFEVVRENSACGFGVRRVLGEGLVVVEHLEYFLSLIRYCLFSERQVTEMIVKGIAAVEKRGLLKPGSRITWEINQQMLGRDWQRHAACGDPV